MSILQSHCVHDMLQLYFMAHSSYNTTLLCTAVRHTTITVTEQQPRLANTDLLHT
jgi:hypothetical protein